MVLMCGIAGLINTGNVDTLARMAGVLEHRGPDDSGIRWFDEHGSGIAHRRLSILDLSIAGHQPMMSESGRYWITYNGEVYNYRTLRADLEGRGFRFRSGTDTEVILAAFEQWGSGCVARFNGMFAFAIYDVVTRSVFLARDHLGIKPLYYRRADRTLAFASEAKALFEIPGFERQIDPDAVWSALMLLWVPEPRTGFAGVEKLLPGHYAWFRDGVLDVHQYWDVPIGESHGVRSEASLVDELCELLERSVERQMVSDVPIGSLLSGGLDSSLVTALMRKVSGGQIHTFTIGFTEADKRMEAMPDDARYAREVARHLETRHEEIVVRPNINALLDPMLWHLDEPIADGAAINTYLISEAARSAGTTVLLSGMGADEIFGGYRKHLASLRIASYRRIPGLVRRLLINGTVNALPAAINGRGLRPVRWAKKFVRGAELPALDAFIRGFSYFTPAELSRLMRGGTGTSSHGSAGEASGDAWIEDTWAVRRYRELSERVRDLPLLDQMTYLDTKLFLPGLNLAYTDKASMAASVETRPPLIDVDIVEFAARLSGRMKIRGVTQKYLLKKAAERYLPARIVHRPKAAFGTPIRAWMRSGLADELRARLGDASGAHAQWLDGAFGIRLLDEHIAGREDHAHRLWGIMVVAAWLELNSPGGARPTGLRHAIEEQ